MHGIGSRVVREHHLSHPGSSTRTSTGGCPVVDVTFDGTWHKRGRTSHHGVGIVMEIDTGLVLDYQLLSNFCRGCVSGPSPSSPDYDKWLAEHITFCPSTIKVHRTAWKSMLPKMSSVTLSWIGILCMEQFCAMGIQKPFPTWMIKKLNDIEVLKEDCVNHHIAKRMYNALDTLKKTDKQELNRKLTKLQFEKITNTYATNLKANALDVAKMKQCVLGGILHMASIDTAPNHRRVLKAHHHGASSTEPSPRESQRTPWRFAPTFCPCCRPTPL